MSQYTLLLGDDWDLHVGSDANIRTTANNLNTTKEQYAYAVAQNVANAFRLFTEDAYYNPERGIPHFAIELKRHPAISVLKSRLQQAALAVEGVSKCTIYIKSLEGRELSGYAELTLDNGDTANVNI